MLYFCLGFHEKLMDYKKKSLNKMNHNESYEEIDTRLASGWYVDNVGGNKKKKQVGIVYKLPHAILARKMSSVALINTRITSVVFSGNRVFTSGPMKRKRILKPGFEILSKK